MDAVAILDQNLVNSRLGLNVHNICTLNSKHPRGQALTTVLHNPSCNNIHEHNLVSREYS